MRVAIVPALFWSSAAAIVYAYVGYPAALAALVRVRRNGRGNQRRGRSAPPGAWPVVSVVIAAHNEAAVIRQKLANTLQLDYPAELLEIIVAADGSTDETVSIAREFEPRVTVLHRPERLGKTAAITRAVGVATGDVVLFSDANNIYDANVLREIAAPFADPEVGAAAGSKVIVEGDGSLGDAEGTYWRYESRIKELEWELGCCTAVTGEVLAIRRSLFEPPPAGVINDDFYIAMRVVKAGYRIAYAPAARSYERVSPTAADESTRRSRIIAGRYQAMTFLHRLLPAGRPLIAWQVISHKVVRALVPLFMIAALVANVISVLRPPRGRGLTAAVNLAAPYGALALAAQGVFYGLAVAGRQGTQTGRPGTASRLLYLPAFIVRSNAAALVGLVRFARGAQSARWDRAARRTDELSRTDA